MDDVGAVIEALSDFVGSYIRKRDASDLLLLRVDNVVGFFKYLF